MVKITLAISRRIGRLDVLLDSLSIRGMENLQLNVLSVMI